MYLPEGPDRPDTSELDAFWRAACENHPELAQGPGYQIRWIGLDDASTEQVIELIETGDKNLDMASGPIHCTEYLENSQNFHN